MYLLNFFSKGKGGGTGLVSKKGHLYDSIRQVWHIKITV